MTRFGTIIPVLAAGVAIGFLAALALDGKSSRPPEPEPCPEAVSPPPQAPEPGPRPDPASLPRATDRVLAGVGDRLADQFLDDFVLLPEEARQRGLPVDLFEMWLPRGWLNSWIPKPSLVELVDSGVIPVVIHYFFGDGISRERVERERDAWHQSLTRMAHAVRIDGPVLVVLVPEFNDAPPPGETRLTTWAGFGGELAEAVRLIRDRAPNALVGVCAGDFSPDRDLEPVLAPVAHRLDFLAFQEMRAVTDPDLGPADYLEVGRSAVEYAAYLHETFQRPILIAYVAVSSYGGWAEQQAAALRDLARRRGELLRHGVFGVVYFELRDDPDHVGYFGPAEKHFGLLTASGQEKPAAAAFREVATPP